MKITPYFLSGIYLTLAARPDVVALIDAPRCEQDVGGRGGFLQDRRGTLFGDGAYARNRRVYSPGHWMHPGASSSAEDDLLKTLDSIAERHPNNPILLARGYLSALANTDLAGLASEWSERTGHRIATVSQGSLDDDWRDGAAAAQLALLSIYENDDAPLRPLITGWGPMRMEGDEIGNLIELQRLFALATGTDAGFLLDGQLNGAWHRPDAPHIVLGETDPENAIDSLQLPALPYGLGATDAFVRKLAEHRHEFSNDPATFDVSVWDRERQETQEQLLPLAIRQLAGRGAAVVADPARARGLTHALRELGLEVAQVYLLRRMDAVCPEADELSALGVQVLRDSDYYDARATLFEAAEDGAIEVIVGAGIFLDATREAGLAYVEEGFPCYLDHFIMPTPTMGTYGLLYLAERLDRALAQRAHRNRNQTRG